MPKTKSNSLVDTEHQVPSLDSTEWLGPCLPDPTTPENMLASCLRSQPSVPPQEVWGKLQVSPRMNSSTDKEQKMIFLFHKNVTFVIYRYSKPTGGTSVSEERIPDQAREASGSLTGHLPSGPTLSSTVQGRHPNILRKSSTGTHSYRQLVLGTLY